MRRDRTSGLGRTQRLVLMLLANGEKSVRTLASDGFGLTETGAWGVLDRLARRGLVDRHFLSSKRETVYFLTREGAELERTLTGLDDDGEGDES